MKMKIQCSVCEAEEASVLCCADEAALCCGCDLKVHASNKLASKHHRVSLTNSSCSSLNNMPYCDICQETVGYFFCIEDRALLCRKCDVAIHFIASPHQRFLMTGVKVGSEPSKRCASSSGKSKSSKKMLDTESRAISTKEGQMSMSGQQNKRLSVQAGGVSEFAPTKLPFAGGSASGNSQQSQLEPTECVAPSSIGKVKSKKKVRETESRPLSKKVAQMSLADQHSKGLSVDAGVIHFAPSKLLLPGGSESVSIQQWLLDENFGSTDLLDQNYIYLDNVSSKADSAKRGDSECSPFLRAAEAELDGDEYLSQVPESAWNVPESALTASGVNWPKSSYPHQGDCTGFCS